MNSISGIAGASDNGSTEALFFRGKRPWSRIKDQVLGSYMPPYLSKVATLGPQIVLIDAFAGPGEFDDKSEGSPLIICKAAERHAKGKYLAIFVNRQRKLHDKLAQVLKPFSDQKTVIPILGTAKELLAEVRRVLTDQTVFLYLDPFGLKGCEFSTLEPFLERDKRHSTEVVLNLSVPTMHRLAARKATFESGTVPMRLQSFHRRLSQVLGGDYWKDILWNKTTTPEEKAEAVMAEYRDKLVAFGLPYTGSCPVREKASGGIKYYITFCSRHRDAMLLMNEAMCSAYHQRMHETKTTGTLFEGSDWKSERVVGDLPGLVVDLVARLPGRSRSEVWEAIVQGHFMRYRANEYRKVVAELVKENKIRWQDVRKTGRLNDDSRLSPRTPVGG